MMWALREHLKTRLKCGVYGLFLSLFGITSAHAELRICNTTSSRVGIAIGYRDAQGWATEGWWNLTPKGCETLLKGKLAARFYYIHAVDYDKGGEWGGKSLMCVRDREFSVRGTDNCLSRGFDRAGFFEVDTGEQYGWTIQLTEPRAERFGVPSLGPRVTP
jgi:uncharacterized membrane protein